MAVVKTYGESTNLRLGNAFGRNDDVHGMIKIKLVFSNLVWGCHI